MPKEVNPQDTTRATAYELWMKAPSQELSDVMTEAFKNRLKEI